MKPTLLKSNVTREEAIEIMDYLYCEYIEHIDKYDNNIIEWFANGNKIAKWTDMYRNIMIDEDFLNGIRNFNDCV